MATFSIQHVKDAANRALANNDIIGAIDCVEIVQAAFFRKQRYPVELEQHVLRVARFLIMARYGKINQPRLAPALRSGTITLGMSMRAKQGLPVKKQQWR